MRNEWMEEQDAANVEVNGFNATSDTATEVSDSAHSRRIFESVSRQLMSAVGQWLYLYGTDERWTVVGTAK
jgi:hypothetical protein